MKLSSMMELINQTVGDAMSDLLMVEAILMDEKMSLVDWDSQYTDLPNKLMKVKVCVILSTVVYTFNSGS